MKFGKQIKRLADPTHLNHYVAYDVLKKAINVVVASEQSPQEVAPDINADIKAVNEAFGKPTTDALEIRTCRPPDSRFHDLLRHELAKVNRFAALQLRTLVDALREAQRPLLLSEGSQPLSAEALSTAEKLLDAAAEDLVKLEHFRRLNFTGFRKIVKKFDKQTEATKTGRGSLQSWFVPQLMREFFVAVTFDPLILALAWGYSLLRRHRRGVATLSELPKIAMSPVLDEAASTSTPAPLGKTTTFWLMPSTRMRALCAFVKRFELVLPPTGPSSETVDEAAASSHMDQRQKQILSMTPEGLSGLPKLSTEVSMVYYDNSAFEMYAEILQQEEGVGPTGFRSRRTTVDGCSAEAGVELVERDGCRSALGVNAFTGSLSSTRTPDSFPVQRGAASSDNAALALREAAAAAVAGADSRSAVSAFATEVGVAAQDDQLRPVATVGSVRVLLKGDTAGTQGVRIAIDEDVQFSHGPVGPAVDAPSDAIDFPYCLLEVASDSIEGNDSWLDEVRGFAAIRSIAGFSTGVHAVAALHQKDVLELPHWFEHLAAVETSAPPQAWGLTLEWRAAVEEVKRERAASEAWQEAAVHGAAAGLGTPEVGPEVPPIWPPAVAADRDSHLIPVERIEPKNFLASERTMLEWLHTVLALAFLGIGLWKYSLSLPADVDCSGLSAGVDCSDVSASQGPLAPPPPAFGLFSTANASAFFLSCYSLSLVAVAIAFTWYSVFAHIRRNKALFTDKHTEGVFNTRLGPTLFVVSIGAALLLHIVIQVVPLFDDDQTVTASLAKLVRNHTVTAALIAAI